jgi:hypothetical protein
MTGAMTNPRALVEKTQRLMEIDVEARTGAASRLIAAPL